MHLRPINTITGAVGAASILGLVIGCLAAWFVFSTHLDARLSYAGFVPSALVVFVYSAAAVTIFGRYQQSIAKLLFAELVGLAVTFVISAVLIQMIGCRFDACINL
jgi:hypothetical protein